MIACDGGCDNWFHGDCVNITEEDGGLVDKYICANCTTLEKHTTWQRMCRLKGCRKPVRLYTEPPSKWCSDEHRSEWAMNMVNSMPTDDEPSRGGVLKQGELKAMLDQTNNAEEFRALGHKRPRAPGGVDIEDPDIKLAFKKWVRAKFASRKSGASQASNVANPAGGPKPEDEYWNDFFSEDEQVRLLDIYDKIDQFEVDRAGFKDYEKLIKMVVAYGIKIAAELNPATHKKICGYDLRLSVNSHDEIRRFRKTEEGEKIFAAGFLTAPPDGGDSEDTRKGVCIRNPCIKHRDWLKVHLQDTMFEEGEAVRQIRKLNTTEVDMWERAQVHEAQMADPYYQGKVTVMYQSKMGAKIAKLRKNAPS